MCHITLRRIFEIPFPPHITNEKSILKCKNIMKFMKNEAIDGKLHDKKMLTERNTNTMKIYVSHSTTCSNFYLIYISKFIQVLVEFR
jgi:hypothetical protein